MPQNEETEDKKAVDIEINLKIKVATSGDFVNRIEKSTLEGFVAGLTKKATNEYLKEMKTALGELKTDSFKSSIEVGATWS